MNLQHEFKVGIFIIASIALLIYVILWLHKFDMASYLHISARFEDVGTLSAGSNVLYRGVKAGTIDDIDISEDNMYAIVKMDITNKNVKIHEGSIAYIISKGVTGTQALTITPPKDYKNHCLLKNGDIIEGKESITLDTIQKILTNLSEEMTIEDFIKDTHKLIVNTNDLTEKMDQLITNSEHLLSKENGDDLNSFLDAAYDLSKSLKVTSNKLNTILNDKEVSKDIKESLSATNSAMKQLNKVVEKAELLMDESRETVADVNETVDNIDETINDASIHGSIRESMTKLSDILTDINDITGDEQTKKDLKDAIKESSESIKTINCVGKGLSKTLSKRFLIPQMLIGNPGKELTECSHLNSISEEEIEEALSKEEKNKDE